ncbi:hypothetical protein Tco_1216892 [Tanacetum coccineum]
MVSVVLAGCSRVVGLDGGFGCVSSASDQTIIRYAAEVVVAECGGCSLDSEGSHLQPEDDRVVVAVAVVKMLGRDGSGGRNVAGGGGSHMGFSSKLVHLSRKLDNLAKRIVYLAFHVISRLLETGPEEISGLRADLFTPRKSALNLLGEETQEKTYNGMIKRANENNGVAKQGLQGRVIGKVNEGVYTSNVAYQEDLDAAEVVVGESGGCSLDSEGSHLQPEDDRVVVAAAVVKMLGHDGSGGRNVAGGGGSHMGFSSKLVHLSRKEEISGLRDDLFTPRKSALNLLGVISISKEKTYNGMIKRANENNGVAKQGLQGRVISKVNEGVYTSNVAYQEDLDDAEVVVGESGGCSLDSEGSHLQPEDDMVVVAVAVVKMLGRDGSGGRNAAGGGGSHMGFSSKLVHLSRKNCYLRTGMEACLTTLFISVMNKKVQDITEWEEDADEYIRTSHLNRRCKHLVVFNFKVLDWEDRKLPVRPRHTFLGVRGRLHQKRLVVGLEQKATEALERKKRNAVEGQIMAEYRAQKEAERQDKFRISVTIELRAWKEATQKRKGLLAISFSSCDGGKDYITGENHAARLLSWICSTNRKFEWFVESTAQQVKIVAGIHAYGTVLALNHMLRQNRPNEKQELTAPVANNVTVLVVTINFYVSQILKSV